MTPAETTAEIFRRVLVPAVTGGQLTIEAPFGRKAAFAAADVFGGLDATREEIALDQWLGANAMQNGEEALLQIRFKSLSPAGRRTRRRSVSYRSARTVAWLEVDAS